MTAQITSYGDDFAVERQREKYLKFMFFFFTPCGYRGGVEVDFHSFISSALD